MYVPILHAYFNLLIPCNDDSLKTWCNEILLVGKQLLFIPCGWFSHDVTYISCIKILVWDSTHLKMSDSWCHLSTVSVLLKCMAQVYSSLSVAYLAWSFHVGNNPEGMLCSYSNWARRFYRLIDPDTSIRFWD